MHAKLLQLFVLHRIVRINLQSDTSSLVEANVKDALVVIPAHAAGLQGEAFGPHLCELPPFDDAV